MPDNYLKTAMEQSARDLGCEPSDFLKAENTVVISKPKQGAKVYFGEPQDFMLVRYGKCSVVAVNEKIYERTAKYFTENESLGLTDLGGLGLKIKYLLFHYLPSEEQAELPCRYETRLLLPSDLEPLHLPPWTDNALCHDPKNKDMFGVGAYDGEKLVGLSCASCDCESMWQIGIDVLPEYRLQGIASALTSQLSQEIKKHGKTPFYTHNFGNLPSMKNAYKSGFKPAWITVQAEFIK